MTNHPLPVSTEIKSSHLPGNAEARSNLFEIDEGMHISSPNNEDMVSKNDEIGDTKQRVSLSRRRRACFFISYSGFLILFLTFFLVIAYTYPLKPEIYIQHFYLPVFDNISSNITEEMKELVYFELWFYNRNQLISVSYDHFPNMTISYLPNSTTSIFFANITLPSFYQHKVKPVTVAVQTPPAGLSGLLPLKKEFSTMFFHVDLEFSMTFHCRELGKHKHRFRMTAGFEVSLETGTTFGDNFQMTDEHVS